MYVRRQPVVTQFCACQKQVYKKCSGVKESACKAKFIYATDDVYAPAVQQGSWSQINLVINAELDAYNAFRYTW